VFDPNVLVSGLISARGTPALLVELIDAGIVVPIVCPNLLDELRRVLKRPKFRRYVSTDQASTFLSELAHSAEHRADPTQPPSVSRDPDDDYLIALARTARADALVSGDADLTDLHLNDLPVLTPRQLLDELAAGLSREAPEPQTNDE
jgi:putative PIN family toxin of toxin-antitoxin system